MRFQVDERKVTHYLLASPSKATFFIGAGYSLAAWAVLRDDLLKHPLSANREGTQADRWGTKTLYRCEMPTAPNGRRYCIRTVWQLQTDGVWKLVTAYPRHDLSARP